MRGRRIVTGLLAGLVLALGPAGAALVGPGALAAELWRADFDFARSDAGWERIDGFWDVTDRSYRGRARDTGWTLAGDAGWRDYILEGRFRSDAEDPGEVGILCRVRDAGPGEQTGHYYLIAHDVRDGRVRLWLVEDGRILLDEARVALAPGVWYGFELEVQGRYLRYRLDGERLFEHRQADEYPAGRIGLGTAGGTAWFDDLIVNELPPPREAEPHDRGRPLQKESERGR
jgi:hypothetical protein